MTLQKAKGIIVFAENQMRVEDKGRFQDICFTQYVIAKKFLLKGETNV